MRKRKFANPQKQKLYEQSLRALANGLGDELSDFNCWRGNSIHQMIWEGIHWDRITQRFPARKPYTPALLYACFAAGRDWSRKNN